MKVKLTRNTIVAGAFATVGTVAEVSASEGHMLIGAGKALPTDEPVKAAKNTREKKSGSDGGNTAPPPAIGGTVDDLDDFGDGSDDQGEGA